MFFWQGKAARMTQLTDEQKANISEMASPSCMDSGERKRQYAAMARAIHKSCNPTLLAKYNLCSDGERRHPTRKQCMSVNVTIHIDLIKGFRLAKASYN